MGMGPYDRFRDGRMGYFDPSTGCWCPRRRRRRRRRRYWGMSPYSDYQDNYNNDWDWDWDDNM